MCGLNVTVKTSYIGPIVPQKCKFLHCEYPGIRKQLSHPFRNVTNIFMENLTCAIFGNF